MSDKKITELNNITSANLSDVDEFVVVDISEDETKAITYGELKQFNVEQKFYFENGVTNGTFDTDTTGWNVEAGDETLSVVSGRLRVTFGADGAAGSASGGYQQITGLTIGKLYSLFVGARYTGTNGTVGVNIQQVIGGTSIVNFYGFSDATNESATFTAPSASVLVRVYGGYGTAGTYVEADNISVFEVDANDDVIHTMPEGWKPKDVFEDGLLQREGAVHDYEVVYDGFDYVVKPTVAPSITTQTCVIGVKA